MDIDLNAVTQQQPTEEQILKNTQLEQQKVLVNYLKVWKKYIMLAYPCKHQFDEDFSN